LYEFVLLREEGQPRKLGELRGINALGFFCWGRSLKIHIEI
jgi:hypothetical protein